MKKVMDKLIYFINMPFSRKIQLLKFKFLNIYAIFFYKPRLKYCGRNVLIFKPLFWTPEYISIQDDVLLWHGSRIEAIDKYGTKRFSPLISFGNRVSLQQFCHIVAAGKLNIGDDVTISINVMINDTEHSYEQYSKNVLEQELIQKDITIGSTCFIGAGAKILAGTTLGDHCIVGANAVVKGIFPTGSVIVGNPGKVIKRYDPVGQTWISFSKVKE